MTYLEYCQLMGQTAEGMRQAQRAIDHAKNAEKGYDEILARLADLTSRLESVKAQAEGKSESIQSS